MTPLLLLPGMMCDARLFAPQIGALSARWPVMACPIWAHTTVSELAKDVLAHAPPKFALAGLSMGGIVAMEIVRQAPDRVTRLALLDTNPLAEQDDAKARRVPQMEAVKAGDLRRVMRDEMKPNYLAETPNRQAVLDLCMEMATALGPQAFLNQSQALRDRPDQSETLRNFHGPSLVLCGRHDSLCPVSRHELMAELLPNARLKVIENAGHLPALEQPEETTVALQRWMEAQ